MCGIFAYTGFRNAAPILLDGLRSLEYRGYDSAGVFLPETGAVKAVGEVRVLAEKMNEHHFGNAGIAHTRWATHGVPSEENAHPHADCSGDLWIVHNGIIENYAALKKELAGKGHRFASETDSEVLAHLIEEEKRTHSTSLEDAVSRALSRVTGTYGIAVSSREAPETIIAARMGSPLVIGIGEREFFLASDPSALARHTRHVVFLEDGELALITPTAYRLSAPGGGWITRTPSALDIAVEDLKRGGQGHFMLKEIMEQPEVVENSLRGRLIVEDGLAQLGGLREVADALSGVRRVVIVGCGSAYYAGLVGKYMFEEYAGVPTEIEIGSELRYRKMTYEEKTVVIAVSQSGETADTLAAIREAKRHGALTLGIVNAVGSTIARETDAGVYNHAGPEIGVASTKAFVSQLTVLALFALFLGRQRTMSLTMGKRIAEELRVLPDKIRSIVTNAPALERAAKAYAPYRDFLFIGRKYNLPIAYEGALKLKEVSYAHAEGYGAGEMKHGPLAMIDENFPTVAVALRDSVYEKMLSNIQEIKARRGRVFAIATEGDMDIGSIADDVFFVPKTLEMLSPILAVVPLQLFAYYSAVEKGANVDKPRNLAKSVTVE